MLWMKILAFIFLVGCIAAHDKYTYHYVEDKCKEGNETVTYVLDPSSSKTSSIVLKAVKYPPYSPKRDCMIVLTAPHEYGIVLSIKKVDFIEDFFACSDYIKIILPSESKTFCKFIFDLQETRSFYTDGPMKFLYHSEARKFGLYLEIGFQMTATAVKNGHSGCSNFLCDNGLCIEKDLLCDGHNNCGDNSDESRKTCDSIPSPTDNVEGYVVYACVGVLFTICMATTTFYLVYKRRKIAGNQIPTESSVNSNIGSRYEAMHPASNFCNQNPDGSRSHTNFSRPVGIDQDGGISNPYYSLGPPPPPYNP